MRSIANYVTNENREMPIFLHTPYVFVRGKYLSPQTQVPVTIDTSLWRVGHKCLTNADNQRIWQHSKSWTSNNAVCLHQHLNEQAAHRHEKIKRSYFAMRSVCTIFLALRHDRYTENSRKSELPNGIIEDFPTFLLMITDCNGNSQCNADNPGNIGNQASRRNFCALHSENMPCSVHQYMQSDRNPYIEIPLAVHPPEI